MNGGRSRSNNSNVNGGAAGDQMVKAPSLQPSPDSISEFRVLSHNYDASLGRNSGSVLNVITKSGTTAFHASAYEFLRNNVLNAKGISIPRQQISNKMNSAARLADPSVAIRLSFSSPTKGDGCARESVPIP